MAGHSRAKDGVLSHAYVPAIYVFDGAKSVKTWMPGIKPGMTKDAPPVRPRARGDPALARSGTLCWIPAFRGDEREMDCVPAYCFFAVGLALRGSSFGLT